MTTTDHTARDEAQIRQRISQWVAVCLLLPGPSIPAYRRSISYYKRILLLHHGLGSVSIKRFSIRDMCFPWGEMELAPIEIPVHGILERVGRDHRHVWSIDSDETQVEERMDIGSKEQAV